VVSSHLIQLGQQAVADVTVNVAKGEPLVRCQQGCRAGSAPFIQGVQSSIVPMTAVALFLLA
jgi:hypothetical protein